MFGHYPASSSKRGEKSCDFADFAKARRMKGCFADIQKEVRRLVAGHVVGKDKLVMETLSARFMRTSGRRLLVDDDSRTFRAEWLAFLERSYAVVKVGHNYVNILDEVPSMEGVASALELYIRVEGEGTSFIMPMSSVSETKGHESYPNSGEDMSISTRWTGAAPIGECVIGGGPSELLVANKWERPWT